LAVRHCGNRCRGTCLAVRSALGAANKEVAASGRATAASGAQAEWPEVKTATLARSAAAAGAQAEVEMWGVVTPRTVEEAAEIWLAVNPVVAEAEA